jgi:DNA repair protein RadC
MNTNYFKLKVQVQLVRDKAVSPLLVVKNPDEVYQIVKHEIQKWDRERFLAVMLNARNGVIGIDEVSCGSVNASVVHPREVFKAAILANAVFLMLIHNHPSGYVDPSKDDIELTQQLVKSGQILGIEVIDHLIVSSKEYYSFRHAGLI